MRDALSLLDQCAAFHFGETLTYEHVLDVLGAVDNSRIPGPVPCDPGEPDKGLHPETRGDGSPGPGNCPSL